MKKCVNCKKEHGSKLLINEDWIEIDWCEDCLFGKAKGKSKELFEKKENVQHAQDIL